MTLECRHIKTSGGKCGSPALRGQPYCYFHSRLKERAANQPSFLPDALANLEDRSAIQHALTQVAMALADHRLDTKRAGVLLYALQIASGNAKNSDQIVSSEAVSQITLTKKGEEMAPKNATSGPAGEPSLADLLHKEIKKQRKAEDERKAQEFERAEIRLQSNQDFSPDQSSQPQENKDLTRKS